MINNSKFNDLIGVGYENFSSGANFLDKYDVCSHSNYFGIPGSNKPILIAKAGLIKQKKVIPLDIICHSLK